MIPEGNKGCFFNEIVEPKMKIRHHLLDLVFVPKLYDFLSLMEHKRRHSDKHFWRSVFVHTMKVSGVQNNTDPIGFLFMDNKNKQTFYRTYFLLCSTEERRLVTLRRLFLHVYIQSESFLEELCVLHLIFLHPNSWLLFASVHTSL